MPNLLSVARIGPYSGSQPHSHDCWEIGFYLSGHGIAHVGDNRVPFAPGTVICYPPHIPHSERARDACLGFFLAADRCPFGDGTAPVHTDRSWDNFLHLISLLHHEWSHRGARWKDATDHLFALLLIHLERQCSMPERMHPLVGLLRREIDSRMTDPDFQVGNSLAHLPMSPDHLRRLFAQEIGCSPLAYLNELRIAKARQLLREGRWLVKEVAAQVGIPDEYYFSRLFLKHTGQRPLAYSRSIESRVN